MTREEAIAIIENEKKCVNRANKNDHCNRDCYNCELVKTDTEILTALDMAIKSLEHEDILDKIKAEIDSHCSDNRDRNDGLYIAMKIIDKYKSKGEKKMSEISETEIEAMTKEQNYMRGYKDGKSDVLDKIKAEIDKQYDRVQPYNISCAEGLEMALEIIDKYRT